MSETTRTGLSEARTGTVEPPAQKPTVAHMDHDELRCEVRELRVQALVQCDECRGTMEEYRAAGRADALDDVLDLLQSGEVRE